jgi:predicted ester cyclase
MIRAAFPEDLRITHDDTISSENRVVIRWTSSGTQKGQLMGNPPSGKKTTVAGIDIFRVAGGKLAELWQNWDQLGMLQQIGAVPVPAQAGR